MVGLLSCPWPSFSLSLLLPFAVKRTRASKAVVFSVAVLPRAVAIFGSLPLSTCVLLFSF